MITLENEHHDSVCVPKNDSRKSLIEKVIWLIEDSYPDTDMWGHDELVKNVTRDLGSRSDELKKMFD